MLWDSERQALQWELGKLSTSQRALRGRGRAGEGTPSEEVTALSVLGTQGAVHCIRHC